MHTNGFYIQISTSRSLLKAIILISFEKKLFIATESSKTEELVKYLYDYFLTQFPLHFTWLRPTWKQCCYNVTKQSFIWLMQPTVNHSLHNVIRLKMLLPQSILERQKQNNVFGARPLQSGGWRRKENVTHPISSLHSNVICIRPEDVNMQYILEVPL
jgi:hypothetical protein